MPKAIWRGVVNMGDARVPVKLYSAIQEQRVEFHLLHDQDESRLRQELTCELEDKPVPRDESVRAVQVDATHYVVVEPAQLKTLEPPESRDIRVLAMAPAEQVDVRYFQRGYYLGPDGDDELYAALLSAMRQEGRAGICQWVFRKRHYAGVLLAGKTLELVSVRMADELVAPDELGLTSPQLNQREIKTAQYLVDELSEPFDPGRYTNAFQQQLAELVAAKAAGKKAPSKRPRTAKATKEDQLLHALEASVTQARQRRKEHAK
jgi:DNA end-binding protein Ku